MSDMITAEAAGKLLDGTTPGPWRYRPHKHDDWGVVRGGVFNEDWGGYPHLAQVRDPDKLDDPILSAHRASGKDPWEANARLTAAAPDLARTVIALHAQLADAKGRVAALEWFSETTAEAAQAAYTRVAALATVTPPATEAKVGALTAALVDHNDLLRSALQICERAIMHDEFRVLANWDAFHDRVSVTLKKHHAVTNEARASLASADGGAK